MLKIRFSPSDSGLNLPSQSFELETKPLPLEKDFLSYLSRDKRSKSNLTQAGLEPVIAAASTPLFLRQTGLQYGAHTEPGLTVGMLHLNLKTRNHEKTPFETGTRPAKKAKDRTYGSQRSKPLRRPAQLDGPSSRQS